MQKTQVKPTMEKQVDRQLFFQRQRIKESLSAQESWGRRGRFFLRLMLCLFFFYYDFHVFPSWLIKLIRLKRTWGEKIGLLQLSIVSNLVL